ncbi:MAG: DNA-binding protein [Desulfuromonadales bacterium]|nr:DNA-binding protein [Desulfuromonadales bacterium]MBN2793530.1 DNA-binding protein [Desulfuromonadales bacterium]
MKRTLVLLLIATTTLLLAACSKNEPQTTTTSAPSPAPQTTSAPISPAAPSGTSGEVIETMNAAGYTYVCVDNGQEKVWAAAPEFAVSVGDQVMVPEGMAMHNYHSQTLNRDFPVVYFVESVLNASNPTVASASSAAMGQMQMPEGHPPITGAKAAEEIDFTSIVKPEGGLTIGEIYTGKTELSGKDVKLRGKVVKFSPQIMGTNWIHIQDGSGDQASGTHDLTVTSNAQVKVGDTIVASGPLTLDKDFGYGYKYNLIMENAMVSVE